MLSPIVDAKTFMPLHLLLFKRSNTSNRADKHARQFAFEGRGDAKLHFLSHQMHNDTGQRRPEDRRAEASRKAGDPLLNSDSPLFNSGERDLLLTSGSFLTVEI
jgi:hypothetical protein